MSLYNVDLLFHFYFDEFLFLGRLEATEHLRWISSTFLSQNLWKFF